MLFGYARVSKGDDQSNALQKKALQSAGVERIFEESASGGRWDCHFQKRTALTRRGVQPRQKRSSLQGLLLNSCSVLRNDARDSRLAD